MDLVQEDIRFTKALNYFNTGNWYRAHDAFEELWHETLGPERQTIQGLLQIAVAQVHLQRGNRVGATILCGEGLGRLKRPETPDLGLDIQMLCRCLELRLQFLQNGGDPEDFSVPSLLKRS